MLRRTTSFLLYLRMPLSLGHSFSLGGVNRSPYFPRAERLELERLRDRSIE